LLIHYREVELILRKCVKCGKLLELTKDNFQPSFDAKTKKTYFKRKCRECERTQCRQYHRENRTNILARKKQYEYDHKEERIEHRKAYNQSIKGKQKNAARARKRYHQKKHDPIYLLRRKVSLTIS